MKGAFEALLRGFSLHLLEKVLQKRKIGMILREKTQKTEKIWKSQGVCAKKCEKEQKNFSKGVKKRF